MELTKEQKELLVKMSKIERMGTMTKFEKGTLERKVANSLLEKALVQRVGSFWVLTIEAERIIKKLAEENQTK